jgi:1,4-alpha-glucan branching enzyme
MIKKNYFEENGKNLARVTFSLPSNIWADQISLVGDFNGWDRTFHPFQRGRDGTWTISVTLETGRSYKFYYLSDATDRMYDAQASELCPLLAPACVTLAVSESLAV